VRLEKEGYEAAVEPLKARKGARVSVTLVRSTALLAVETTPAGLSISIDGKAAGQSRSRARDVAPGVHKVVVDDPCWVLDGESVALKKGEEKTCGSRRRPAGGPQGQAEDEKGNDLEGTASVDGREVGAVPAASGSRCAVSAWRCGRPAAGAGRRSSRAGGRRRGSRGAWWR